MPMISITSAPKITYLPNQIPSCSPLLKTRSVPSSSIPNVGSVIECSSRPQKKATKHHMKTRPRKTQAWDIRRKPTVYAPLPPLPPEWTLVSSAAADTFENDDGGVVAGAAAEAGGAGSALQAPPASG
ncbi:plastid-specific 50S ribosomal protein 6 [Corchorus capsularis]|uniref:Plastid-specific 50S ribosomal protein 6 n=1 Tax=Corchorus capsularis TaxID=210143 RepID=A0A1R3FYF7_COCAP|nr:plastid-specific 50S ribosomal protein 6 [Corchorus capsularis]